ncbi:11378_t:CDS:2, partial [Scutellospora calospora]
RAALNKYEMENLESNINKEIAFVESDNDTSAENDEELNESESDLDGALRWKSNLTSKAENTFSSNRRVNIMQLIYGEKAPDEVALNNVSNQVQDARNKNDRCSIKSEDDFFKIADTDTGNTEILKSIDSSKLCFDIKDIDEWEDETMLESIRNKFITGSLEDENLTELDDSDHDKDDKVCGNFSVRSEAFKGAEFAKIESDAFCNLDASVSEASCKSITILSPSPFSNSVRYQAC